MADVSSDWAFGAAAILLAAWTSLPASFSLACAEFSMGASLMWTEPSSQLS